MRSAIFALSLLALAGCGSSPPTNFYMLSATDGVQTGAAAPVQVAAVHVPPSLDRREMVSKTGNQSVKISETDRWTAHFGDMVRNVLSEDLQKRLPKGSVILPDAPTPRGTRSIVVTIADFTPQADGKVHLSASWSLTKDGSSEAMVHRDVSLEGNSGSGAAGQAASMSEVLGKLADDIASNLGQRA